MDGLEQRAFNKLAMDGIFDKNEVTAEAQAAFERNYLKPLQAVKHKPRYTVQFRGMLFASAARTDIQLNHFTPRYAQGRYKLRPAGAKNITGP